MMLAGNERTSIQSKSGGFVDERIARAFGSVIREADRVAFCDINIEHCKLFFVKPARDEYLIDIARIWLHRARHRYHRAIALRKDR